MRRALMAAPLVVFSCVEPTQNPGLLPINPNAAAKNLALIDRYQDGGAPAAADAPRARVRRMKEGEQLAGPNATGRPGDFVLENDEIAIVIDQLGSSHGIAESGGNVVDAADAKERRDELGEILTYFGAFPRQGVYTELTAGTQPDGSAWVEAKGHELYEKDLGVTTRYTLHGPDRALLIHTQLANKSDHAIDKLKLGDEVQWGGTERVAPGKPVGFTGTSTGPYVGAIGRFTSYAITSTDGQIDGTSGGSWTDTTQSQEIDLAPGAKVEYARVFLVGARGDVASLIAELLHASGQSLGGLEVLAVDENGQTVTTPAGAKLEVRDARDIPLFSFRATHEGDALGGEIAPGKYTIAYASGGGRAARGARVPVEVTANKVTKAKVTVSSAGRFLATCVEDKKPSPCKVTIEGSSGTPSPDLGPAHVAGPAKNQVTSESGSIDVALAPGTYKVTASRGPEFDIATKDIAIEPGKTAKWDAALARVVDTKGYVAVDLHQHTAMSADSAVALRDRAIANAAEGVEIAALTDHNVVADLAPAIRELHLERFVAAISGDELTSDTSRKPWGHATVVPFSFDASKARGGAPDVRDRTPKDVLEDLRRARTDPFLVQINHPRSGITGYFNQLGFDASTGVGSEPGYDAAFDALELWTGRNVRARENVLTDFLALLRTSHPATATAGSDTHGIVGNEPGYPRTMVRVADDEHLEAWSPARTSELVTSLKTARDVVLTNGPFLRVTANNARIGGIAKHKDVVVNVHVEHAPWITVDEVRVVRASGGDDAHGLTTKPAKSGARAADLALRLHFDQDDAFVIIVSGKKPMTPVLAGDAAEIAPWAMTGAIWVDADADGKALGREK